MTDIIREAQTTLAIQSGATEIPTPSRTRTITLTDRAPVTIREDQWPVIARAFERPDRVGNRQEPDYETDAYSLRVRQHEDGRALVYGVVDAATEWTHTDDWRGGELLHPGADIARAIRRVGEAGGMPDSVVRGCIADLPAVAL